MGYYLPLKGEITVGNINLKNLNSRFWRNRSGVVLQDGYLFSENIAENISISEEEIDKKKLQLICLDEG